MAPFRDFIPEGEDTGAQGKGYDDFVPPKVPEIVTPEPVVIKEEPKKKK